MCDALFENLTDFELYSQLASQPLFLGIECLKLYEEDSMGALGGNNNSYFNPNTSSGFHIFEIYGGHVGLVLQLALIALIVFGTLGFMGWMWVKCRHGRARDRALHQYYAQAIGSDRLLDQGHIPTDVPLSLLNQGIARLTKRNNRAKRLRDDLARTAFKNAGDPEGGPGGESHHEDVESGLRKEAGGCAVCEYHHLENGCHSCGKGQ